MNKYATIFYETDKKTIETDKVILTYLKKYL